MPAREVPAAVTTRCPSCGLETSHDVLHGTMGGRAKRTLEATARCSQCGHTHHVTVREDADVELPAIVSQGERSEKRKVKLAPDERLRVGDEVPVEGVPCRLTGIETKDGKRVEGALVREARTLWLKRFDMVEVGVAINMDKKTIAKSLTVEPTREFTVGEELLFGRLRVTVHAIKTEERLLSRGSAEAGDIVRVFAKPTPLARPEPRPDKRTREALREKEERRAARKAAKGRGPK